LRNVSSGERIIFNMRNLFDLYIVPHVDTYVTNFAMIMALKVEDVGTPIETC
jgi:hypothetical protein